MKILQNTLIVLAVLIAIPLVVASFVEKGYDVEREIVINKPQQAVFDYVKYLKNQDNYSKWASMDPDMKKTYRGTDGAVGFVSAWHSNDENVGKGEQEIIKITAGKRIDFELRFFEPYEATEPAFMSMDTIDEKQTKVVWGVGVHMNYPMNLMFLFMDFKKNIGDDLDIGLKNLKAELEQEDNQLTNPETEKMPV